VQTDYRLLRWDDFVREDMARAPWWKIVQMYRTIGIAVVSGAFCRILRADWRFAVFAFSLLLLITTWNFLACFLRSLVHESCYHDARAGYRVACCRRRHRHWRLRFAALAGGTRHRADAAIRPG
jgi:hypothetical protein